MTPDQVLDQAARILRDCWSTTLLCMDDVLESPIEKLFAAGILASGIFAPDKESILLIKRTVVFGKIEQPTKDGIICRPQAKVGPYRVDFLLQQHLDGKTQYLIVECDGHAFHEATKAQAAKDKKRNRYFASIGLPVIHFTGAELYRSPESCAMEALSILKAGLENV